MMIYVRKNKKLIGTSVVLKNGDGTYSCSNCSFYVTPLDVRRCPVCRSWLYWPDGPLLPSSEDPLR